MQKQMTPHCKISNDFKNFYAEILKSVNITMQCNLKVMNQQKCREQPKLTKLMVQIKH